MNQIPIKMMREGDKWRVTVPSVAGCDIGDNGEIYLSDNASAKLLSKLIHGGQEHSESLVDSLSDRELEVFRLIGQGLGTREIADELHLSIKTIETYRAHLKGKLNLKKSTELVKYAVQWVETEAKG